VWVDGQRVLQNVGYDTVSDYVPLPSGEQRVRVAPVRSLSVVEGGLVGERRARTAHRVHDRRRGSQSSASWSDLPRQSRRTARGDREGSRHQRRGRHRTDQRGIAGRPTFGAVTFSTASRYVPVSPNTYAVRVSADGKTVLDVPKIVLARASSIRSQ